MSSQVDYERIKNIKGFALRLFGDKQNTKSIQILEKLIPFAPKDEDIPLLISRNYSDQDMKEDAIFTLQEAIRKIGATKKLLYELCLLMKDEELLREELIKNINALLVIDPNDNDTLLMQANLMIQQNQYEQAIPIFKTICATDKNNHVSLRSIALCYKNLGQPQQSLEYSTLSLKICKDDLLAQAIKANAILALKQGGEDEARKTLDSIEQSTQATFLNEFQNLRTSQIQLLSELKNKSRTSC